jgi:hypothetical protein
MTTMILFIFMTIIDSLYEHYVHYPLLNVYLIIRRFCNFLYYRLQVIALSRHFSVLSVTVAGIEPWTFQILG